MSSHRFIVNKEGDANSYIQANISFSDIIEASRINSIIKLIEENKKLEIDPSCLAEFEDVNLDGWSTEGNYPLAFTKVEYPHGILRIMDAWQQCTFYYPILDRQFLEGRQIGRILADKPIKVEYA